MEEAERIELDAYRAVFELPPARVLEVGDAVGLALPPLPEMRMLNRAGGITSRTTDTELDRMEAFFGELGVQYQLSPAEPGLEGRLTARGLVAGHAWMKFTRGPAAVPPARTDLRTVHATGAAGVADFARILRETWGFPGELHAWLTAIPELPGWTCYVAYDGDEAAGAAALYVRGDAAWLGFGSTLPAFRGRGGQAALLAARVADAAAQGATLVVTETGVPREDGPGPSYRNILRAGFREAYPRPNYVRP